MPIPVKSPTDIEIAIEEWLVRKIEEFKAARRQQNQRYIFTDPSVAVAIFDGKLTRIGRLIFRADCPVHVQIGLTRADGEEARRDKVNPLIMAVMQSLARQRFGLAITDLIPVTFKDVTTEEDFKQNRIVYDLTFSTSFNLQILPDDDETDLISIALQYFLKPGDDVMDAEDIVEIGGIS
jgi:hypothetical protein